MTLEKEEESDSKNIKGHKMYVDYTRKGMKNHGLSMNRMFLHCSDCIVWKEVTLVQ